MYCENIRLIQTATQVAISAFLSYWLVKIVPYWGLALLATTLLFTVPLVYTSNQELIDHHLQNAQEIVNAQTEQLKKVAGTHTAHATEVTKQFMGDYTAKAQEMLRGSKAKAPEAAPQPAAPANQPASSVRESDFPAAPKEDFKAPTEPTAAAPEPEVKHEEEPLIAT